MERLFWLVFIVLTVYVVATRDAEAHVVTNRQCYSYGQLHRFTTGKPAATAAIACRDRAARHRAQHVTVECVSLPSGMGVQTCAALAWVKPAWAVNRPLHELLRRESTWNPNAVNDKSHACGLFQFLPCRWSYRVDPDRVYATPLVQVRAGVRYITGRYGSPEAALAFHDAHGWY